MTEMDDLVARLRKLEPIAPEPEFSRSVQRRGRERLRAGVGESRFASTVVAGAVIAYLGWALHFTSGLYH